ncbi:MAG: AmmeMemoRadiSam system protein A [Alphaproteobacteria bacterium]|nr:AmmeMemoRadiSam system protein A [Alphaproteobacteria bacterium]
MSCADQRDGIARALAEHGGILLRVARASILNGLRAGGPAAIDTKLYDDALRGPAASFVTLHIDRALRGCTGSARARRALVEDVSENAFNSAFGDPRFPPLTVAEYGRVEIGISVLTEPEPLAAANEAALLAALAPGEDGLLLEADGARGLFLPQVWHTLPDPAGFLDALKDKAGLPRGPLRDGFRASRFRVVEIAE